jgi:hypothetical protein
VSKKSHVVIAQFIRAHPQKTWQQVATFFGVSVSLISHVAKESGLSRPVGLDDETIANRASRGEEISGE